MMRWILSSVGLIAIGILIWFIGPMLALGESKPLESMTSRIIAIVIVILIWSIIDLIKRLNEKKANDALIQELSQEALAAQAAAEADAEKKAATDEELTGLQNNFQEALDILKKTKMKGRGGQQHLYELPWYIIIGPPGSGKTTALANSGLHFPLSERFGPNALRGVGGTRDCDWWFTDEAVLLDTAGRYTTQDSDADIDSGAWSGFLEMLKKYRKRRPINGVLVALSVSDLMHSNEAERIAHADAIKQRIQELRDQLGVNPPVYMLFTKCDLISGFTEYFDDLGREERKQVWGLTLPLQESPSREQLSSTFSKEFSALIERLNTRLMSRLNQERDMQRRSQIHAFPHQVSSLKENADHFLQEVFGPNRYQQNFILRGVYFTSGTQEGTPIDRMMGSLASTFGLDRQSAPMFSGQGRSYFLTRLFEDLVFEESDIVGVNAKLERQATLIRRGSYAAAIAITTAAAVGWTISYTGNSSYIAAVEKKLALFDKERQTLTLWSKIPDALPALNAISDATNIYTIGELDSFAGLGLSKQITIEHVGMGAYQAALNGILAPRIVKRLEEQLISTSGNVEFMMDALKAYLMMAQPDKREPEFLISWVNSDIQSMLSGSTESQAQLSNHVSQLFSQDFPAQKLSNSVISMARNHLNSFPLAELVYTRLKDEAADEGLAKFNLSKSIGSGAEDLFNLTELKDKKQIAGLFTVDGFKDYYLKNGLELAKESTEQNWVLGSMTDNPEAADPELLNKEIGQLLEQDFVKQWQTLLGGIHIAEFRNIRHGVSIMQRLSSTTSPLKKLLTDVSYNTTLIEPPEKEGKTPKIKVKNKLFKKAQRLAKKAKKFRKEKGEEVVAEPGEYVQAAFLPLNNLATAGDGAKLDELLGLFAEVYIFLEEIASVSDGKAAFDAAKDIMTGQQDILSRMKIKAARYPAPVKQWLKEISDNSWRVVLENAHRYVNTVWQNEVVPDYNRLIKNRYPVFESNTREINMVEFSTFFGPEGTMDLFYANYMAPFIISSGRNWRLKFLEGRGLGISSSSVATLQNADRIKQMFFGSGQLTPTVAFSLKPVDMDARITRFSLDLDGQRIDYRHGPTRSNKLQWPGPDGSNRTRVRFEKADGGSLVNTKDGAWAFYRILDNASIATGSQRNQLKVSFKIKSYSARYTLTTDSGVNPFRRAELAKFRVSDRL
ncbi:MAG: type VI secretion system membrane subunit TssM [Gammaproteobacteria bacterium]|nr:type VI secretion system membrane subunit TssM [Gammaproteobacteria bacterium]